MEGVIAIVIFMTFATLNFFILGADTAQDLLVKLWAMVIGYLLGVFLYERVKR